MKVVNEKGEFKIKIPSMLSSFARSNSHTHTHTHKHKHKLFFRMIKCVFHVNFNL